MTTTKPICHSAFCTMQHHRTCKQQAHIGVLRFMKSPQGNSAPARPNRDARRLQCAIKFVVCREIHLVQVERTAVKHVMAFRPSMWVLPRINVRSVKRQVDDLNIPTQATHVQMRQTTPMHLPTNPVQQLRLLHVSLKVVQGRDDLVLLDCVRLPNEQIVNERQVRIRSRASRVCTQSLHPRV